MYINLNALISLVAIIMILIICLVVLRILLRHQINEIVNTLDEVLNGNDTLHLYTTSSSLLFDLSMRINRLMDLYRQQHVMSTQEESARKQLLSNLSHDIRTPLASVIGYVEAIENGLITEQEKADYLHTALAKAYALKDRVDQLFELVRLDADEVPFHFETIDIYELTRNSLIDFVPLLEQYNFQVEMGVPDDECLIVTDSMALMRIIQNLIRNAASHGSDGRYLGIQVYTEKSHVVIRIEDHGRGINQEELPYIFNRLYQGDHARSVQGGLGLAIAKELALKLGGDIKVMSSKTVTAFTVYLPLTNVR